MSKMPEHYSISIPDLSNKEPRITLSMELSYDLKPKLTYFFKGVVSVPWTTGASPLKIDDSALSNIEPFVSKPFGLMDIPIFADSYIIISLDKEKFDHWQVKVDALTMKSSNGNLYSDLRYYHDKKWFTQAELMASYPDAKPLTIAFKAKRKAAPPEEHSFNMNVVIDNVPMAIDPDIRNPRDP